MPLKNNKRVVEKYEFEGKKLFKKRMTFLDEQMVEDNKEEIPLKEISPKKVFSYRKGLKPFFLIKKDKHLYYFDAKTSEVFFFNKKHLCTDCTHCAAKFENEGGCSKVLDRFPQRNLSDPNRWSSHHCRLEKYSFIVLGYESINYSDKNYVPYNSEFLLVFECKNFEKGENRAYPFRPSF